MALSRSALKSEDGFTLIELMAALAVLLVGVLGVIATMDRTRDAVTISEARETAVHRAEREMERIRALPYTQLGLTAVPTQSPDPDDPASEVEGNRYQWDPTNPARVSDFITGGSIPSRVPWNDGRFSGALQVYVLRYDDPVVAGAAQARRVIVAATVDGATAPKPIVLSTVVHDPGTAP